MISITTKIYDLNGQVIIDPDPDSNLYKNMRRMTRTPTLDGGCVIVDQGVSNADRTLDVRKTGISAAKSDLINYIFRTYSLIQVSFYDGCFEAAIDSLDLNEGKLKMKILIKTRL